MNKDTKTTSMSKPVSHDPTCSDNQPLHCKTSVKTVQLTVWCVRLQLAGSAFVPVGTRVTVCEWHIRVSHSALFCGLWTAGGETLSGWHLHAKPITLFFVTLLLLFFFHISFFLLVPVFEVISLRKPTSACSASHFTLTAATNAHVAPWLCVK